MPFEYHARRILSYVRRACDDYQMITAGDRIAVGLSGGKDSLALLTALCELRRFYPIPFCLTAVMLDMGFYEADFGTREEFLRSVGELSDLCRALSLPFVLKKTSIAQVVFTIRQEKSPCSLCARLRRGALHDAAKEEGCNKVALGHHLDDAVETFLLNLFHEGRIGCFSPVTYLDRKNVTVIRPLIYTPEKEIRYFVRHSNLPLLQSPCPADRDSERARVKTLLSELEQHNKGIKHRIFGAMQKAGVDGYCVTQNFPPQE